MRSTPGELQDAFRDAWPHIVRALASYTGSLDDAEEYAAEAVARAAAHDGDIDELDDRLALLFVACDDELAPGLQMVLALRVVCGLTVPQIAHHLGIQDAAAAARLTRAKKALAAARGEFRTPDPAERAARLPVV